MKVRVRRHAARELADGLGVDPGDARGPGRVLRLAVVLAHEVAAEFFEADGVALQERRVVQPFGDQRVRQSDHDRGVGAGNRRQPFGLEFVGLIGAQRADIDEFDAASGERRNRRDRRMLAGAAGVDLQVLERHAAERHDEARVGGDGIECRRRTADRGRVAEHMRRDDRAGGVGIGVDLHGRAAERIHEAVQQRFRVVQAAGARPAVGAGEDRAIAEAGLHPRQLVGHQRERGVPIDRHERLGAALGAVAACTAFEEALADMGPIDAALVVDCFYLGLRQRRRVLVLLERLHADRAPVPDLDPESTPMGRSPNKTLAHGMPCSYGLQIASGYDLVANYYAFRASATMSE